ncbi:hypothetical protein EYF80_066668 [Liparis tanakae]|uniref:Uncharacterized protein n=1 Tax=Liparis tanakae TaxID=230148 RepID=A0A4Z2E3B8_9TELE|nr:hypothetical protein EYF80_066668 [Liparis tanakae]
MPMAVISCVLCSRHNARPSNRRLSRFVTAAEPSGAHGEPRTGSRAHLQPQTCRSEVCRSEAAGLSPAGLRSAGLRLQV